MKIATNNVAEGKISERQATEDELIQWEADAVFIESIKTEAENKKSAARAKLGKLGLTAEDLQALGLA
ncbi:hypothetical protein UFOVP444_12 [uncultured Caudovirales phage]|uniref:Uncharacterized protein n=1 Tax=uncultured Caudovirales phage TaxID=2100421 RepID=A0A6J5M833_9CAUD|nr:hypothetical protein UFOVP444_12 [uncultured Caudovirales phage]